MSASVCGKRLALEEAFGPPSPLSSAKRRRRSPYDPPAVPTDLAFGSDDKLALLRRLFPSMDREVVETVLNNHDHKLDDAIKYLHALCLEDRSASNESAVLNSLQLSHNNATEDGVASQLPEVHSNGIQERNEIPGHSLPQDRSSWVDLLVQEMMNASDWNDVRGRSLRFLEAFETSVSSSAESNAKVGRLKEQHQCLVKDNQLLKRAVAIQHERIMEHEEKLKEVQQLKHLISQYQEQNRNLEINNYALKLHLQKAQEASSIPNRPHPDIF